MVYLLTVTHLNTLPGSAQINFADAANDSVIAIDQAARQLSSDYWMKTTAAASRGVPATARRSCCTTAITSSGNGASVWLR